VRFLQHKHRRKVSIVGWSLGGVYGFYAAHSAPECVRSVISLGSPMRFTTDNFNTRLFVRAVYRYFAHPMGPVAHLAHVRGKVLKSPPPMPSTCIYSMTDGVVPPQAARLDATEGEHENIWVPGSHLGLGFNAAVMYIVADRLAQAEGDWRPFRMDGHLGSLYERCASLVTRVA
jgi:pimeloyl-ACP methyl ester carboxylesterase